MRPSSSSLDYLPRFCSRSGPRKVSSEHSCLEVKKLRYRPPGTQLDLLNDVSLSLPVKSFGLVFGRSGSGKTTLLQVLFVFSITEVMEVRNNHLKYYYLRELASCFSFLRDTVLEEATFGWPRKKANSSTREQLASNLQYAFSAVGLHTISLEENPHSLSGGFKRRLALAVQLVQKPALLLLDEPLAGLDWKARADVVNLLKHLKKELTILAVSHDLKELSALVDASWRMEMGGILKEEMIT